MLDIQEMAKYDIILFDLDGTLTDPKMEMLTSASYALRQFGIDSPDEQKLMKFLSDPLLQCFEEHFGMTQQQADEAFEHYWQFSVTTGVRNNKPFVGVPELLDELHSMGKTMCIATARQTENAKLVLESCGLDKYFKIILGASEDLSRRTKKMIIFDVLSDLPDYDDKPVVMVGDRVSDITGAYANGIDSIGVTYSLEVHDELLQAEPTHIAHSVDDMKKILVDES